jgi:hypothetical protein
MVGFKYRTPGRKMVVIVHPLGNLDITVPVLMHCIDGIEEELLVVRIWGYPKGGG